MEIYIPSYERHSWLEEASIEEIQKKVGAGKITYKEMVLFYLERIAKFDQSNIHSILEVNPEAAQIAEAMDFERKSKKIRGPLHGIPVLLKDNIDTHDKMHTSAGSLALKDSYAPKDATIVTQLRKAGAVILGKANMTEWANFMSDHMPSGYSSRGGQTLNPYGPGRFDVGGSSSGSAAAVAANFTPLAIGTETSGSILSPASQNSVVGIKPTLGLLSRKGIIPIAHSRDTCGPIARTVKDAVILLSTLCTLDKDDPITLTKSEEFLRNYANFLDPKGLDGARIGIPRKYYYDMLSNEQIPVMQRAIRDLKNSGASVIDPVTIPSAGMSEDIKVLIYEFKSDLNAYLKNIDPKLPIHSLKELIDFNNGSPKEMLKYGQSILLESEQTSGSLIEAEYLTHFVQDLYYSQNQGIDFVMKEHNLDAILFPANIGAGISAKAGYPSITVPGGYTTSGEPLGITFTAQAYSEPILIRLAYAFEQNTKYRVPPTLQ